MDTPASRICPVCGGENEGEEPSCSFCGAPSEGGRTPSGLPAGQATPAPDLSLEASPPPAAFPAGETGPRGPDAADAPQARAPVPATPAPRFAGFWIRFCAYILDSIIIQFIIWLLLFVAIFGYTLGSAGAVSAAAFQEIYQAQWGSIAGLDIVVKLAYYTLFLGRSGRTPAKKLFGLRVVRTDGGPVTHGQALIRTIGYYINMLTLEIGFLWVAFDRRKQGLHDKIAGTLEIREWPSS